MTPQVHDELVFEVPGSDGKPSEVKERSGKTSEVEEERLTSITNHITDIMTSVMKLKVPIKAEAKHGTNWRDLKSIS